MRLGISTFVRHDGDFSPPSHTGSDAAGVAAVFNFGDGHGDRSAGVSGTKANGDIDGAQWVKLGDADAGDNADRGSGKLPLQGSLSLREMC